MSDTEPLEDEPETPGPRQLREALERAEKRNAELEERVKTNERRDAMRDAGLDLSDPKHAWFAEKYDGEMKADAVKAEAARLGFITEAPSVVLEEGESESTDERRELHAGAKGDEPPKTNPYQSAIEAGLAAQDAGMTREQSFAEGMKFIREAAAKGDERVLVPPT